ncbi:hypothetical protein F4V57_00645 [Acinetobacter qingfengensis]|uniref:Uncharacterized protein n=1 Tax=Acinetobacter qingfengensis TaxID=1262585 RepID=A0A1E7RDB5_9GAMM|nr:hypothetical protein [Acinetobacter qingfengensis]KAA8735344.1 hypothetical protein F4V57_00645 [Acinetobacter qingfengensis]OEY97331.1 hypothetical protein BJI46_10630 [Acinetobacter qingfengensis]
MQELQKQFRPDHNPEFLQDFQQLRLRERKIAIWMMLALAMLCISGVLLWFNQSLIYALFEITPQVQHLHLPESAQALQQKLGENPDYFMQLLLWIFWLGLKLTGAILGASLTLYLLKKFRFITDRIRGFFKNVMLWCVLALMSWLGIAYLQHEVIQQDQVQQHYQQAMLYQHDIRQSEIYQDLQQLHIDATVQAYVLAQTALLHQPADREQAKVYLQQIISEEQQQSANFQRYGFQPAQLWAMQQQVYGQAVTASAKSIQQKVTSANQMTQYSRWLWQILLLIAALAVVIFYGLHRHITQRIIRIETQLQHIGDG